MTMDACVRIVSAAMLATGVLAGCATVEQPDPLEKMNRRVFAFNEGVDKYLIVPPATVYRDVVPQRVREGVDNFFNNLKDAWSSVNLVLQGRLGDASNDVMRFSVNTVLGLGGILDWGTELGLEPHREDFGQTLGRWGLPAGLYLVWPLLGPSSLRDSAALPLDVGWSPSLAVRNDQAASNSLTALRLIDTRAGLLGASRVLDDVALDKYQFVRDAYLSRRRSLVYDGEPPELPAEADEPAAPAAPAAPASAPK